MVRQPAVAGTFYPADATILRQTVKHLLRPSVALFETEPLKALIVPHAGYVYSGAVAGHGYAQLVAHAETVRRIILLGPTHRAPVRGSSIGTPEDLQRWTAGRRLLVREFERARGDRGQPRARRPRSWPRDRHCGRDRLLRASGDLTWSFRATSAGSSSGRVQPR